MADPSSVEKGGAGFEGIKLLLCENPLPPIDEAVEAAENALPHSTYYTEPYSEPPRTLLSEKLEIPKPHLHINAGSS